MTLFQAGCSGCVVPPPLTVQADAGPDSPPVITEYRDSALNAHRPPDTLTINRATQSNLSVDVYDTDVNDDLFLQLFVDYNPVNPVDARVNCAAVPTGAPQRTATCAENTLCLQSDVGTAHRLEVEVYDRMPEPNAPYRDDPPGMFSTWTFDLNCIDQQ